MPIAWWAIKQKHIVQGQKEKSRGDETLSRLLLSTAEAFPEFVITNPPPIQMNTGLWVISSAPLLRLVISKARWLLSK